MPDKEYIIPDNVYLIIPHCCGSSNFASTLTFGLISNDEIIDKINKFKFNSYKNNILNITEFYSNNFLMKNICHNIEDKDKFYIILKPGDKICDLTLEIYNDISIKEGIYINELKNINYLDMFKLNIEKYNLYHKTIILNKHIYKENYN